MAWTGEHREHVECGSSDGLAIYEEGGRENGYCFACNTYVKDLGENNIVEMKKDNIDFNEINALPYSAIKERGISKETCEFYKVKFSKDKIYFPYFKGGKISGYKVRDLKATDKGKRYSCIGDIKDCGLFGSESFNGQGKLVVVTEGEIDALSIFQVVKQLKGKEYRILSLPNGVGSIKKHLDYLEQFESIYLCFDNDPAGQKEINTAASLFTPGKVSIISITGAKDPNELLTQGKERELLRVLNNAKKFELDGIINSRETWEVINNRERALSVVYPSEWQILQEKTHGIRLGELETWTSGSGSGKTQVMRHLQYNILTRTQANIGVIALEEPIEDSVEALMGMYLKKRISLERVRSKVPKEELRKAWDDTMGKGRLYFYDHFGSIETDNLIKRIRYMAKSFDCQYIFIDHLGIVISEYASEGSERERIDSIMTKLKSLTQELKVWIGLVVHLRKREVGNKSFENGITPTLDDCRGSGAIKQLSNSVFALTRDQQADTEEERNTITLTVLKCRYTGDTGKADQLYYDRDTGWFRSLIDQDQTNIGSKLKK